MRIKYRRMILFIIVFTMAMGMVTFSIGGNKKNNDSSRLLSDDEIAAAKSSELKKNQYDKVNSLIKNYTDAKLEKDVEKLSLYVSDPDKINDDELNVLTSYIEGYKAIDCYTIDVPIENTYVVYVYKEYKMKNIDTVIPSIVRHYVCPDSKGNLVIYSGMVDKSVNEFIENTRQNPKVKDLINQVNNQILQVKESDPVAKAFLDKLDEVVGEDEATKKPASTNKADAVTSEEPKTSSEADESKKPEVSADTNESKAPEISAEVSDSNAPKTSGDATESKAPQVSKETAQTTKKPAAAQ